MSQGRIGQQRRVTVRGLMIGALLIAGSAAGAVNDSATNHLADSGSRPGPFAQLANPDPVSLGETRRGKATSWWRWPRATGNWWQMRPALETNGLVFAGRFLLDSSAGLTGDVRQRGIQRGLLDLNATFDLEPLLGIAGGTLLAQYYYRYGPRGGDDIGDMQGYDNLDAGQLNQVEEIWYEQKLARDQLRLKVGQVDANAEFDNLPAAGGFINSSAGYSPALLNIPTYPNPALSANLFVSPTAWFYCGAGIYTSNLRQFSADRLQHPYYIGECGLTHAGAGHFGPGRVAAGVWHDTVKLSRFDGAAQNGTSGYYVIAEQQIWKRRSAPDAHQGISVFVQYAHANPEVSPVAEHTGAGVSATGLLPGRENDAMGIYVSRVSLSRGTGAGFTQDEATLEGFYQCQVNSFLVLKPDIQWINHPGGHNAPAAAWVATLRILIVF